MRTRAGGLQDSGGSSTLVPPRGRSGSSGLPGPLFLAAKVLFALSVAGALAALGTFFWYDAEFWNRFDVGPVLKVAAVLLSGFVISSGLLYFHHSYRRTYSTFESLLYALVLLFSLLNLVWIAPVLLFV